MIVLVPFEVEYCEEVDVEGDGYMVRPLVVGVDVDTK